MQNAECIFACFVVQHHTQPPFAVAKVAHTSLQVACTTHHHTRVGGAGIV